MDSRKDKSHLGSSSVEEILATGRDLLQNGEAATLLPIVAEAQAAWPGNIAITGMLAETYLKLEKYEKTLVVLGDIVQGERAPFWADVCYANALEKLKRLEEASAFFCSALGKKYSERLVFRNLRLLPFVPSRENCVHHICEAIEESIDPELELGEVYAQFADYVRQRRDYGSAMILYGKAIEAGNQKDKIFRKNIFCCIRQEVYADAKKTLQSWDDCGGKELSVKRVAKFLSQKILSQPHYRILQDILLNEYYKHEQELYECTDSEVLDHYLTVGLDNGLNPNPWFDTDYFVEHYGDKIKEGEPPLIAYLRLEGKEPVRPSVCFDPDFYRDTNPDLHSVKSVFAHYSKHGHFEGRQGTSRKIPEAVVTELDEISKIEPKVVGAAADLHRIVRYPRVYRSLFVPDMINKRFKDIEVVVCVPFLSRGGADLVSTYALKAIQQNIGNEKTLLLVTDQVNVETSEWYTDDTNVVVLNRECEFEDDDDKLATLLSIIGKLGPEKILNVNSRLCWEMYREYGKQLSSVVELYSYLFCYDYDQKDRKVGYITEFLPETIKYLNAVFFDNENIVDSIKTQYGFSESNNAKLRCIYTPSAEISIEVLNNSKSGDKILWIGRLARQKRPDVLIDIAEAMPSLEFHVYGDRGNSASSERIIRNSIPNIKFLGTYSDIEELKLEQYAMFLLTSQWEGIPTILISMMAFGLPVVSPVVGGIGELVDDDTGWPVTVYDDSEEYCEVIRQVLLDDRERRRRQEAAKKAVKNRHCWRQFEGGLTDLGLLTGSGKKLIEVSG